MEEILGFSKTKSLPDSDFPEGIFIQSPNLLLFFQNFQKTNTKRQINTKSQH